MKQRYNATVRLNPLISPLTSNGHTCFYHPMRQAPKKVGDFHYCRQCLQAIEEEKSKKSELPSDESPIRNSILATPYPVSSDGLVLAKPMNGER